MINISLEIALMQLNVYFGDPDKNLNQVSNIIQSFTPQIDVEYTILLLPELFTTGYDLDAINKHAEPLEDSKALKLLLKFAKHKKIWIYTSIPEKDENKTYNTGILISPKGELVSSYRKIHLFGPLGEKKAFKCGKEVVQVQTPWGNTGLMICYDLRFPEQFIPLRNANTRLYLLVAEWPIQRIDHWIALAKARAIENQAYFVGLNRIGMDPTATYGGNSIVIAPDGTVEGKLGSTEGVLSVKIEMGKIQAIQSLFKITEDANTPLEFRSTKLD